MTEWKRYLIQRLEELAEEAGDKGMYYISQVLDHAKAEVENSEEGEDDDSDH